MALVQIETGLKGVMRQTTFKKIKGKLFKFLVKSAMILDSETSPVKKATQNHQNRSEVAKMRCTDNDREDTK